MKGRGNVLKMLEGVGKRGIDIQDTTSICLKLLEDK